MTKRYYTLRFGCNDSLHKAGEQVINADNTLYIGQTVACDIRLNNDTQFEDAVIAVIEKREADKGWKIIKLSPYMEHEVRINGTPINHVHFLNDGDRIAFEGQRQELAFNTREDELYTSSGIVRMGKRSNRTLTAWMLLISVALIGFVIQQLHSRPMSSKMIERAKQSVFQIKVDTVALTVCRGDSVTVLETAVLHDVFGTAFLTTDGILVTARHCIEPWLDVTDGTHMDTVDASTEPQIKMALKAVTNNIIAESQGDDTRWQMVSHCSLWKLETNGDKPVLRTTSTAFCYDDTRDNIMDLGDYDHHYFWRSIKVRPHRTDMMLGDIAFLPNASSLLNQKGNIPMATKEEVIRYCRKPNRPLIIMGRTNNNTDSEQIQSPTANLKLQISESQCKDGYPNTVIAHNGNISHGFSGGPVMTRRGLFGFCVIGAVSVTDMDNENWYYSVPVSEIERILKQE